MTGNKTLKQRSHAIDAFTNVGKNGITENTVLQLERHLKAHKLSKIRILPTYLEETGRDIKEVAEELSKNTKSELVDIRGQTITFYKR
ncbi:MAG: YhbY family RNA-binding protein [Nanoarchaeota archaeon]